MPNIRCMCCGREFPSNFSWYVCNVCGFRVCPGYVGNIVDRMAAALNAVNT